MLYRFVRPPTSVGFARCCVGKTSLTRSLRSLPFAHAKDGFTHGLKDMSFMARAPLRGRERGRKTWEISCPP